MKNMDVIQSMPDKEIIKAIELETYINKLQPVKLATHHTLHAGVYTRTIVLEPSQVASGVIISIPTTLIVTGHVKLFIGDEIKTIKGFNVFIADANRKQIALAIEKSTIVMVFKTNATSISEAEEEFTKEPEKLVSRLPKSINYIKQGLLLCQE